MLEFEFLTVIVNQEKPVAAPCNIARHRSKTGHFDCDVHCEPVTRYVCDFDFTVIVKSCDDNSDWCLDAMCAWTDAIQVRQRGDDSDCSMAAHPKVCDAVEEDHSRDARLVNRSAQQSAYHGVRPTRLVHDSATKVVVLISETLETVRQRIVAEIWSATNNHARRLTARV